MADSIPPPDARSAPTAAAPAKPGSAAAGASPAPRTEAIAAEQAALLRALSRVYADACQCRQRRAETGPGGAREGSRDGERG